MDTVRPSARAFIAGLCILTGITFVLAPGRTWAGGSMQIILALALGLLMMITFLFPLPLTFKTTLVLDTSVIMTSALLFDPRVAMLVACVGTLAAHAVRRTGWDSAEATFNSAQAALQAGVAGSILLAAGWDPVRPHFDTLGFLLGFPLAGLALFAVNTAAVAGIVALQTGLDPLAVWRESRTRFDAAEWPALLALGVLATLLVATHAWALPLLLLPGVVLHRMLALHARQFKQDMDAVVYALADAIDQRDPHTAGHSRRVAALAHVLAAAAGLPPEEAELIFRAARVHDIGRLSIDESVIVKSDALTAEDVGGIRRSPAIGAGILRDFPQFTLAADLVLHHMERVDGAGYPDGLTGDDIPLGSRIIAVADSLDAMASGRRHRAALPFDAIVTELQRQRGRQWDDRVVEVALELLAGGRVTLATGTSAGDILVELPTAALPPPARHAGEPAAPRAADAPRQPISLHAPRAMRWPAWKDALVLATLALVAIAALTTSGITGPHAADVTLPALAIGALAGLTFCWRRWWVLRGEVRRHRTHERELRQRAFHDTLTGLPNRALFVDRLTHALERAERYHETTAVLFLDFDDFKAINDTFGHAAGDDLLVNAAERLGGCIRVGDTAARLAGDEFTVLLENVTGDDDPSWVAERISSAMREPFALDGTLVRTSASIGVALAAPGRHTADSLLHEADLALYRAKRTGKARIAFHAAGD